MPTVQSPALLVVVAAVCLVVFALYVAIFVIFFPPWIQAYLSGVRLMITELIGMKLRRTDIKAVTRALIVAKQGGVTIPPAEMEKAWVQGVDLEKVTMAVVRAKKEELDLTFQELVDAELENRLADKLEGKREARAEEAAYI